MNKNDIYVFSFPLILFLSDVFHGFFAKDATEMSEEYEVDYLRQQGKDVKEEDEARLSPLIEQVING